MRFAILAHRATATNAGLAEPHVPGVETALLTPRQALLELGSRDVALARLDVRPELDGVEDGLSQLEHLARIGVTVLNPPAALLAAHDKLLTVRMLRRAGLPHPQTTLVAQGLPWPELDPPLVLKPRFGSWGREVFLCRDRDELSRTVATLSEREWFRSHGALAQEVLPLLGYDLRIVVAAGRIVGAARRDAAPDESLAQRAETPPLASGERTLPSAGQGASSHRRQPRLSSRLPPQQPRAPISSAST